MRTARNSILKFSLGNQRFENLNGELVLNCMVKCRSTKVDANYGTPLHIVL